MDDLSPVRLKPKNDIRYNRSSNNGLWFRLDTAIKDVNKSKCFNGPTDNRSYCAYDLASARATFGWFAITKIINGRYPLWANQYDLWPPNIKPELEDYWYALCFTFVLAENRCVVTKFEKDNPVEGVPEVYIDNPLSPINKESFWNAILKPSIDKLDKNNTAKLLAEGITELYRYWNSNYCQGQILENVGLHNEPYFKYFSYSDFLTPHSGLIQIKKYAELEGLHDLLTRFSEVSELTKRVKKELYRILYAEFKYFE